MSFTVIAGVTKSTTQKSARQLSLKVKEDLADDYEECPSEALKSVVLDVEGENDEGAFGDNTIGQKIVGKVILYAADAAIRTFAHELVSKTVKAVELTTNSGNSYAFAVGAGVTRPVLTFSYEKANLVTEKTTPTAITLNITGYRDNLVIN
jgi:hypothetical protein